MGQSDLNTIEIPEDDKLVLVDTDAEASEPQDASTETPPAEPPAADAAKPPPEAQPDPDTDARPPRRRGKTRDDRIKELTWKAHEAEERAAAAETRLEMRERHLLAQQAKFLQEREAELNALKDEAIKEGDMASYDSINTKLTALQKSEGYGAPVDVPDPPATPDPEPATPNVTPATQAWLDENAWFFDTANAGLAQKAIAIEQELADKYGRGFQLYKALDEKLESDPDFSAIYGRDDSLAGDDSAGQGKTNPPPKSTPEARPVRGGDRGEAPPETQTKADEHGLTEHDKAVMRRFNLDPNDPDVRKSYLKRKGK